MDVTVARHAAEYRPPREPRTCRPSLTSRASSSTSNSTHGLSRSVYPERGGRGRRAVVSVRSPRTISFQVTRMDERQCPGRRGLHGQRSPRATCSGTSSTSRRSISRCAARRACSRASSDVYAEVDAPWTSNATRTVEAGVHPARRRRQRDMRRTGLEFDFDTVSVTIPISQVKDRAHLRAPLSRARARRARTRAPRSTRERDNDCGRRRQRWTGSTA